MDMKTLNYFGTDLSSAGHYFWVLIEGSIVNSRVFFHDLPFHPEGLTGDLVKGKWVFDTFMGYSILAIAGSCTDDRGGTKSVFWIYEEVTKEELIGIIHHNTAAMKIINKFPFKCTLKNSD